MVVAKKGSPLSALLLYRILVSECSLKIGRMGHRHSAEGPNLASHVSRSGGPWIVSLSVGLYPCDLPC